MNAAEIFSQVARLLDTHPFAGAQAQDLMEVLDACDFSLRQAGHVLCAEGEVGRALYFLLDGTVSVRRQGRPLVTITAPALLGHMSLVDGTPRSASCAVDEEAYIGTLRLDSYRSFLADTGAAGAAFRRLLLCSLNQQLLRGNDRCHRIINGLDGREQVEGVIGALEGWAR